MDFWQILLNSIPVGSIGIVFGFLATKGFDLLYKKYEFKLEARKIFYIKKVEAGEKAVTLLQTYNDNITSLSHLVNHYLSTDDFNGDVFAKSWDDLHATMRDLSGKIMGMLNSSKFYFDIDHIDYNEIDIHRCNSEMNNLISNEDFDEKANDVMMRYKQAMDMLASKNNEMMQAIKSQTKF